MMINQATHNVQTEGFTSQACKIEQNATMYKILSESLYSDRLAAVLREVCCNAYDAHIEANKAHAPFKVELPTTLKPYLTIEDYGLGLSEEDIFYLYTTMFASNKRNNNDQTGGFGLGSKSPLAYVDAFTVVSRHGHSESAYAVFKDETGTPRVGKIESRPYVGTTGLSVQVPIQTHDFNKLRECAKQILPFFVTLPTVNETIKPLEYILKTENFGLLKERNASYGERTRIQIGNVAYPLTGKHYTMNAGDPSYHDIHALTRESLVIFAPIGSVEIAPSREELSYDERTIAYTNQLLRDTFKQFPNAVKQAVDQTTRPWDKLCLYGLIISNINNHATFTPNEEVSKLWHTLFEAIKAPSLKVRFAYAPKKSRYRANSKIELTPINGEFNAENLHKIELCLVTGHTLNEITTILNLHNQNVIDRYTALVFTNDENSQAVKNLLAITDGVDVLDWDNDIAPDLIPLPTKGNTKTLRNNEPRNYWVWVHCGKYRDILTTDRNIMIKKMLEEKHAIFTYGPRNYFDPQCTQHIPDVKAYLRLRNDLAEFIDAPIIVNVLAIPKLLTHKPYTAKPINDILELFEKLITVRPDLWEMLYHYRTDKEFQHTVTSLDSQSIRFLVEDMLDALGETPLSRFYTRYDKRLNEFRAFETLIRQLQIDNIETVIGQHNGKNTPIVQAIYTLHEQYNDLFDSRNEHHIKFFGSYKHYLTLIQKAHS